MKEEREITQHSNTKVKEMCAFSGHLLNTRLSKRLTGRGVLRRFPVTGEIRAVNRCSQGSMSYYVDK